MKIYAIEVMGSDKVVFADEDDVARLVHATQQGVKLVRVRDAFVNPASVSLIRRTYDAVADDLGQNDTAMIERIRELDKRIDVRQLL